MKLWKSVHTPRPFLTPTADILANTEASRHLVFAPAHGVRAAVEVIPMTQVNAALQRVRENKARYRIVLVN